MVMVCALNEGRGLVAESCGGFLVWYRLFCLFLIDSFPALFGWVGLLVFEYCFGSAFASDVEFQCSVWCFVYGAV